MYSLLKYCLCSTFTVFLIFLTITTSVFASDDLWATLLDGGKVILMRHATVMKGADKGNPLLRDVSCINERHLSNTGKRHAEIVGKQFKRRSIPIFEVRHSPFCRTTDTAKIAFGKATPADYLSLIKLLDPIEADNQTEELINIIGSYVGDANLILVTHKPNISAVSSKVLGHLDFLILQPKGDDEFEELGVIQFSPSN